MKNSSKLFTFLSIGPYVGFFAATVFFTQGNTDLGMACMALSGFLSFFIIKHYVDYSAQVISATLHMPALDRVNKPISKHVNPTPTSQAMDKNIKGAIADLKKKGKDNG